MLVAETWLNLRHMDSELSCVGYRVISRKDRLDTKLGRGGGVIILCRAQIKCVPLEVMARVTHELYHFLLIAQ